MCRFNPGQSAAIQRRNLVVRSQRSIKPPVRLRCGRCAHSPCRPGRGPPRSRSCSPAPGSEGSRPLSRGRPDREPLRSGRRSCADSALQKAGRGGGGHKRGGLGNQADEAFSCQRAHAFVEIGRSSLPNCRPQGLTTSLTGYPPSGARRRSRYQVLVKRRAPSFRPFRNDGLQRRAPLPL